MINKYFTGLLAGLFVFPIHSMDTRKKRKRSVLERTSSIDELSVSAKRRGLQNSKQVQPAPSAHTLALQALTNRVPSLKAIITRELLNDEYGLQNFYRLPENAKNIVRSEYQKDREKRSYTFRIGKYFAENKYIMIRSACPDFIMLSDHAELNKQACMGFTQLYNNLDSFTLSCNSKSFPLWVCNLTQLKKLDFSSKRLEGFPLKIRALKNLEILNLQFCNLKNIPRFIYDLKKLRVLNLAFNKIKNIPKDIGKLTRLRALLLHENPLKKIPKDVLLKMNELRTVTVFPQEECDYHSGEELLEVTKQIEHAKKQLKALRKNLEIITVPCNSRFGEKGGDKYYRVPTCAQPSQFSSPELSQSSLTMSR